MVSRSVLGLLGLFCIGLGSSAVFADASSDQRIALLERRLAVLEAALGVTSTGAPGDANMAPRNLNINVQGRTRVMGGKKLELQALDEIVLRVGKSQISMNKSGDIEINGRDVSVKANQQELLVKGSKVSGN
ncbi:hypothetical protein IB286_13175 [Spongiibacter sp. KMU-158]|uniref:Uncharacterized protein n=1 Tax=Spongiibacter pelagi TaxID=2760804 RepID=A0A927GWY4_9GAMM|nr:hypothetical protein [Spongiibacter pelagi]MBD2859955.1 hypothetical protein [Spongiibacter pelagi]